METRSGEHHTLELCLMLSIDVGSGSLNNIDWLRRVDMNEDQSSHRQDLGTNLVILSLRIRWFWGLVLGMYFGQMILQYQWGIQVLCVLSDLIIPVAHFHILDLSCFLLNFNRAVCWTAGTVRDGDLKRWWGVQRLRSSWCYHPYRGDVVVSYWRKKVFWSRWHVPGRKGSSTPTYRSWRLAFSLVRGFTLMRSCSLSMANLCSLPPNIFPSPPHRGFHSHCFNTHAKVPYSAINNQFFLAMTTYRHHDYANLGRWIVGQFRSRGWSILMRYYNISSNTLSLKLKRNQVWTVVKQLMEVCGFPLDSACCGSRAD